MTKIEQIDLGAVRAALFSGAKLASVAAEFGVSVTYLFRMIADTGLAYAWTTAEEREALAALRSGRSVVIGSDEAAAALRLRERIDAAVAEYRTAPARS